MPITTQCDLNERTFCMQLFWLTTLEKPKQLRKLAKAAALQQWRTDYAHAAALTILREMHLGICQEDPFSLQRRQGEHLPAQLSI
jgi:hypothetical protein